MPSGARLAGLGDMAAPAGESNCQTSTLGMIHNASVFPPGQVNGFRSKMKESSKRSGLRKAVPLLSCAPWNLEADSRPAALTNSRRLTLFDFIARFSRCEWFSIASLYSYVLLKPREILHVVQ